MEVTALGSTSAQAATSDTAAAAAIANNNELGQDAFLKLLLTQLEYQDPMNPMGDTEFIAQLAQFTSLSELQKLNATTTEMLTAQGLASAASLIGLNVSGLDDAGGAVSGVAEAALMKDSKIYVRIGGSDVALSTVSEIVSGGSGG
ncbi:MAG: flagellar hook capping FlgD N-terminal domain-containing protein [Anaerolineae bacterium]